ncbi:MAG TPA: hypothetical protein VFP59_16105 [Candidatus Angelobacter sp.]|nr:hypothetical protein [Candidatus Angelobacter sp.]
MNSAAHVAHLMHPAAHLIGNFPQEHLFHGNTQGDHVPMKSHRKNFSLLMCLCFIAATASTAFAQDGSPTGKCSFQKLNLPPLLDNKIVIPEALNDVGAILGTYVQNSHPHGFLLYQGKFTTFMFPGSTDTIAHDINTTGTIVGEYTIRNGPQHAFMVHSGGFHEIKLPGFPHAPAIATGVNDKGDVVGAFQTNFTTSQGFLLHNGKLTILSFPGAQDATTPLSINNQGVIVGTYKLSPSDTFRGFMWKAGVFSNLNPPDSGGHSEPAKISNAGDAVGTYTSTVDGMTHGFSFDKGIFTQIDVPNLKTNGITAVNKFDNVLAEAIQGPTTILFKGFCSAVF